MSKANNILLLRVGVVNIPALKVPKQCSLFLLLKVRWGEGRALKTYKVKL